MEQIILQLLKEHYLTIVDDTTFNVIVHNKVVILTILDKYPDLIVTGSFIRNGVFVAVFQYLPK